jgi:hypothetical protein
MACECCTNEVEFEVTMVNKYDYEIKTHVMAHNKWQAISRAELRNLTYTAQKVEAV